MVFNWLPFLPLSNQRFIVFVDKDYHRDGPIKREGGGGHDNIFDDVGDYVPSDAKDRSYGGSKHRSSHRASEYDSRGDRRGAGGGDYHRSRGDEDQHRSSGARYGGTGGSTYFDKAEEVSTSWREKSCSIKDLPFLADF